MAFKIGFILFTALDAPKATEYAAYKKLARLLEPNNKVKSLAESHPTLPPWRFEAPALNRTPDHRVYKLAAELAPWMDEFHSRVLDRARIRERLKAIERTHFQNDMAEIRYYQQLDRLHAWIRELLFERVYRRVGRNQAMFEKVAQREWMETKTFHEIHREQRLKEARLYPELHEKELVHPYRFEVKVPNDKKILDIEKERALERRRLLAESKAHTAELRRVLHDMIADGFKQQLRLQYMARRDDHDKQARWHLHDLLRAFEKAWIHAWENRDAFRDLVRRAIVEQAEVYPRLFRQDLQDPYVLEIHEPNEKDRQQKFMEHLEHERQEQKLVQLETEAGRQLTRIHKMDLEAYRQVQAAQIEGQRENSQWQDHVLIERKEERVATERDHTFDAKRVESQGYQLLAGRMIPQPRFGIDSDIITGVPLTMGLNGDPRAPEHVTPTPLLLMPVEQRQNWQKLKLVKDAEQHFAELQQTSGWQAKTQGLRQHLAAAEYADQASQEPILTQSQSLGPGPEPRHNVEPSRALDPISQISPDAAETPTRDAGTLTKKKD